MMLSESEPLALFGLGLGIYIAPNNAATMEAAPKARSSQAGGLVNLMRGSRMTWAVSSSHPPPCRGGCMLILVMQREHWTCQLRRL